jgi:3D (Asp-Asp-Asp) domain-containing protein
MKQIRLLVITLTVYAILTSTLLFLSLTIKADAHQIEIVTEYVVKEVQKEIEYQTFEVTAYTAGFESTGKTENHPEYRVTASGELAWENITLACPRSMEFGTKIYFKGIDNIWTCQDRGSAITEGHLDIFMEDLDQALDFGRRNMEVLIIP